MLPLNGVPGQSSAALEAVESVAEMGQRGGLLDDVNRAQGQGLTGLLLVRMAGEDDDRERGMPGADAGERRDAPQTRHDQIEEYAVHRGRFKDVESFGAVESHQRRVSAGTDCFGDDLRHRGIVVNDKDSHESLRAEYPGRPRARQVAI